LSELFLPLQFSGWFLSDKASFSRPLRELPRDPPLSLIATPFLRSLEILRCSHPCMAFLDRTPSLLFRGEANLVCLGGIWRLGFRKVGSSSEFVFLLASSPSIAVPSTSGIERDLLEQALRVPPTVPSFRVSPAEVFFMDALAPKGEANSEGFPAMVYSGSSRRSWRRRIRTDTVLLERRVRANEPLVIAEIPAEKWSATPARRGSRLIIDRPETLQKSLRG